MLAEKRDVRVKEHTHTHTTGGTMKRKEYAHPAHKRHAGRVLLALHLLDADKAEHAEQHGREAARACATRTKKCAERE